MKNKINESLHMRQMSYIPSVGFVATKPTVKYYYELEDNQFIYYPTYGIGQFYVDGIVKELPSEKIFISEKDIVEYDLKDTPLYDLLVFMDGMR